MNWQEVLTILIPMLAFLGWVYNRLDKKFAEVKEEFKTVHTELRSLDLRIQSLDSRISRIEGH